MQRRGTVSTTGTILAKRLWPAAIVAVLLAGPVGVLAEDAAPGASSGLKSIPLEVTPEVEELREGRSLNPYSAVTERSLAPSALPESNRFLVAIDLTKLDSTIVGGSDDTRSAMASTAAETVDERTLYDSAGAEATSFETQYEELNASLQCHWAYNASISDKLEALDAKAREAEAERSFEDQKAGAAPEPEEDAGAASNTDPEFTGIHKERNFTKAGRPCLLTVSCEKQDDPRCDDKFIDEIVKGAVLVRTGE